MAGGAAYNSAVNSATAKGAAESNAEQQRNAQEQQQSKGPSGNPSGSSFGGNSNNVKFDTSGNTIVGGKITQFAGANNRDTYFSERGVGNTGVVTNPTLFEKADFSNLSPGAARDNAQQQGSTFESGGAKVDEPNGGYHLVDTSGRTTFEHDAITGKDTIVPFKPESDISLSVSESPKPQKELIKPSDYGYTKNAVLDPRIKSLGENKSPLEINFDVTQAGRSAQAGSAIGRLGAKINTGGGIETPQSKELGNKFSRESLLSSPSPKMHSKASSVSFSNADYTTGGKADTESVVTIGPKEAAVFGKTSDNQFGWHDIGKTQLSRNSELEKSLVITGNPKETKSEPTSYTPRNANEKTQIESWLSNVNAMGAGHFNTYDAAKALGYVKSSSIGQGSYNPSGKFGGLAGEYGNPKETKPVTFGGNSKGVLLTENLKVNDSLSGIRSSSKSDLNQSSEDFNTFFSNAESKGSIINIYNSQGARIGSVKADEQGKQTLESLGNIQGIYFRESTVSNKSDMLKQNRDYADYIGKYGQEGATVDLFSNGKLVGSVSGKQAYHDALSIGRDYPGGLEARIDYSSTKEGKSIMDAISKGGIVTFFANNNAKSSIGMLYSGNKNAKSTLNDIAYKSPSGFGYQVLYPQQEKQLLSDIAKNPQNYINKPQSFWDQQFSSGKLQTNDISTINTTLRVYAKQQNIPFVEQNKQTAKFIYNVNERNDPSYYFNIKDEKGNVVKTTTGQRAFYDFMKTNIDKNGNVTIEPHFSNTPEAASLREDRLVSNTGGVEAYGNDALKLGETPQLTGLQAPSRGIEQTLGATLGSLESAFVNLYKSNLAGPSKFPGLNGAPETIANILTNSTSSNIFARDFVHTFIPVSLTSLSKGQIKGADVKLTPEATILVNRTSAPNSISYLMGKEAQSPNANKEYYDVQSAFFLGSTLYGLKGALPFRIVSIPLKVENVPKASPAFPSIPYYANPRPMVTGALVIGGDKAYLNNEGHVIYYGKELVSKTASGIRFGSTKPQDIFPEDTRFVLEATRGEEFGTAKPYATSKLTSDSFLQFGEDTGRFYPGTANAIKTLLDIKSKVKESGEYTRYVPEQPTSTENVSPTVGKAVLEQNAKNASFWGKLNIFRGYAIKQGSAVAKEHTHPVISSDIFGDQGFPVQDIDLRVGNPKAGSGGKIFGVLDWSGWQAVQQAELGQNAIEVAQAKESGFNESPLSFREKIRAKLNPISREEKLGLLSHLVEKSNERNFYTGGSGILFEAITTGEKRIPNDAEINFRSTGNIHSDREIIDQYGVFLVSQAKDYFTKIGRNPNEIGFESHSIKATDSWLGSVYNKASGEKYADVTPKEFDQLVKINGKIGGSPLEVMHDKYRIVNDYEVELSKGKTPKKAVSHYDKALIDIENWQKAEDANNINLGSPVSRFEKVDLIPRTDTERELLGNISNRQVTEASGGKILDVMTGAKLVEYTTERDTAHEVGSKLKPQGTLFGEDINYHAYYVPIEGSNLKGPTFGGLHTEQSYLAQIFAFQDVGTLAQQGASEDFGGRIGNYVFVGPKAFGGGKEFARLFGLFRSKAMEMKQNRETLLQGMKIDAQVGLLSNYYGKIYDVDLTSSKAIAGAEYSPPSGYWKSGKSSRVSENISKPSVLSASGINEFGSNSIVINSGQSKLIAIDTSSILSNMSKGSSRSGLSGRSALSGRSGFSSRSGLSGRSALSGRSGLSGKSGLSGLSGKSGISELSGSGSSGSELSGSGSSGRSPSGLSGSGLSGSSLSGKSGSSWITSYSSINSFRFPSLNFGNVGRKRRTPKNDGYTALFKFDVKNPFSTSLSIIEKGNLTWL